jgi:hypothetical protein
MEYVIWGIPPNADPADVALGLAEQPLYTRATTRADAERVAAMLEREHGCQRVRIQELSTDDDGASVQDMFRGAVRRNDRRGHPRPAKR